MENYFSPENAAARYAKGRPAFHANTITRIGAVIGGAPKLERALDVACGTGLSSYALEAIAHKVYGIDTSTEMLKWAQPSEAVTFAVASAEQLPFTDNSFDLVTVASGVHWFNIDAFLSEARRVLKPGAWLVLYDNYFLSRMDGVPAFDSWYPDVYAKRFPAPKRHDNFCWDNGTLHPKGFELVKEDRFNNGVVFTKAALILYLTTQSNITAAIASGTTGYTGVEAWLDMQLSRFFETDNATQVVQFGNWIKFIQRIG